MSQKHSITPSSTASPVLPTNYASASTTLRLEILEVAFCISNAAFSDIRLGEVSGDLLSAEAKVRVPAFGSEAIHR